MPSPTYLDIKSGELREANADGTYNPNGARIHFPYGTILTATSTSDYIASGQDLSGRPIQKAVIITQDLELLGVFKTEAAKRYYFTGYNDDGTAGDFFERIGPCRAQYKPNKSDTGDFKDFTTMIQLTYVGRQSLPSHVTTGTVA